MTVTAASYRILAALKTGDQRCDAIAWKVYEGNKAMTRQACRLGSMAVGRVMRRLWLLGYVRHSDRGYAITPAGLDALRNVELLAIDRANGIR